MDLTDTDTTEGFQPSPTPSREVRAAAKDCVYTFSDNGDSDEGEQLKYKIKNIIQSPPNDEATEDEDDGYHLDSGGAGTGSTRDECTFSTADIQSPGRSNDTVGMSSVHATTAVETATSTAQSFQQHAFDTVSESLSPPLHSDTTTLIMSMRARRTPNGSIPKTGKPMAYAIEKKASRGRTKPKRKALVAMYQSQISDNNIGIKLKLKKSDVSPTPTRTKASASVAASVKGKSKKFAKSNRKRSRKSKAKRSTDDSDDEGGAASLLNDKRPRKEKVNNNREPVEQTEWGSTLPEGVLYQIFRHAVKQEGCLPTLCRLGKVCMLWQRVSQSPSLWNNLDLSRWTRERFRTELKLKWIIENRLSACYDVNLSKYQFQELASQLLHVISSSPVRILLPKMAV